MFQHEKPKLIHAGPPGWMLGDERAAWPLTAKVSAPSRGGRGRRRGRRMSTREGRNSSRKLGFFLSKLSKHTDCPLQLLCASTEGGEAGQVVQEGGAAPTARVHIKTLQTGKVSLPCRTKAVRVRGKISEPLFNVDSPPIHLTWKWRKEGRYGRKWFPPS